MTETNLSFLLAGCLVAFGWWMRASRCRAAGVTLKDLQQLEERITVKLSELNTALEGVNTQLEKVKTEVQTLKDSLKDVELPADAQASLEKLTGLAATIDEINPDAPTPAPSASPAP